MGRGSRGSRGVAAFAGASATVEPHLKKSLCQPLPHSDPKADGFTDQLQHRAYPIEFGHEAAIA
jgi:hypothetical protein